MVGESYGRVVECTCFISLNERGASGLRINNIANYLMAFCSALVFEYTLNRSCTGFQTENRFSCISGDGDFIAI